MAALRLVRRIVFGTTIVASLLLFVGTAVLWARSTKIIQDQVVYEKLDQRFSAYNEAVSRDKSLRLVAVRRAQEGRDIPEALLQKSSASLQKLEAELMAEQERLVARRTWATGRGVGRNWLGVRWYEGCCRRTPASRRSWRCRTGCPPSHSASCRRGAWSEFSGAAAAGRRGRASRAGTTFGRPRTAVPNADWKTV